SPVILCCKSSVFGTCRRLDFLLMRHPQNDRKLPSFRDFVYRRCLLTACCQEGDTLLTPCCQEPWSRVAPSVFEPVGKAVRRADRLFEIIQAMRRKELVRARDLSESLEVSERTIYRDIQDLIASGVPIEGEAGVGYVLKAGFDLPPPMFKEQEVEALVVGGRVVLSPAGPELPAARTGAIPPPPPRGPPP